MPNLEFHQESFNGGLNLQVDPTRINRNEYAYLFNGRTRHGIVEPINSPLLIGAESGLPSGKYRANPGSQYVLDQPTP